MGHKVFVNIALENIEFVLRFPGHKLSSVKFDNLILREIFSFHCLLVHRFF